MTRCPRCHQHGRILYGSCHLCGYDPSPPGELALTGELEPDVVRRGKRHMLSPRQRYESAIDSSTITPEQRRRAHNNAAADPGVETALDEADQAYAIVREAWANRRNG
jgi:hypothetical protein